MGARFAEIYAAPAYGHQQACASLPEGPTEVACRDELRQWLERIAAERPRPLLAEVIRSDGDRLSVGLGRLRSFLSYVAADGNPPYFSVVGDAQQGKVCFDRNGEPSYFAARDTVPFEVALEVACRFAQSRGLPLPELVEWEEV